MRGWPCPHPLLNTALNKGALEPWDRGNWGVALWGMGPFATDEGTTLSAILNEGFWLGLQGGPEAFWKLGTKGACTPSPCWGTRNLILRSGSTQWQARPSRPSAVDPAQVVHIPSLAVLTTRPSLRCQRCLCQVQNSQLSGPHCLSPPLAPSFSWVCKVAWAPG